jgi:exodeoxyribonuclease VII large subunit
LAGLERKRSELMRRMGFAMQHRLARSTQSLERLGASLTSLDPTAVLARGYSLTRNARGEVVRDAAALTEGELLTSTFSRGTAVSEVKSREVQ